jgi:CRP/FNR family transcriptional regulator, cyclic AMP receptor protein
MGDAHIELLKQMPVFGGIRNDALQFLLDRSPIVAVTQDEFFFREGDAAHSMFVLESGKVAILKFWNGEQRLLQRLDRGDCCGEMALMDMMSRSASVRALEDCTAIEIATASLFDLYEKDLEQFTLIQMNMGREVSRRLRIADERLFATMMASSGIDPEHLPRST